MKALLIALLATASLSHATDLAGDAEFQFFNGFNKEDGSYADKFAVNWDNVQSAEVFTAGYSICYKGEESAVTTLFETMMFRFKEAYPTKSINGQMGGYEQNGKLYRTIEITLQGRSKGHSVTQTLKYSAIPACAR